MYSVDEKDQVVELKTIPQSSVGAPRPVVFEILSGPMTAVVDKMKNNLSRKKVFDN